MLVHVQDNMNYFKLSNFSDTHYRHLINYACLQALVNNNAYMVKQLSQITIEKYLKSICSSV